MKSTKTSFQRKLAIHGFRVTENSHNFYALLEFDITNLRKKLRTRRQNGKEGTLFSFFIKAIAECLKLFPDFNSMINLKKTTTFSDVDIAVPVEIMNENETYNRQLVLRNVERMSIGEIEKRINKCKREKHTSKSYIPSPFVQKIFSFLPDFFIATLFKLLTSNHGFVKKYSGTAFVTSVSMFTNVPGFIIPYIGKPKAVSFAIGSVCKKPLVVENKIEIRETVNITAVFNHDIVDGAPAARFINKLRNFIESDYDTFLTD